MSYGYLILALIIMLILCASLLIANSAAVRYWIDGLKLKIPLIGSIIRKIILAHFASTFALLYASGIPVLDAVRITQKTVRNLCIKNALAKVDEAIGAGQNMTSAFQSAALFPPLIIRMLKVGETTGALDKALANISYFYNRDVKEAVERIQAMIEPALTLFLGGILGWIMLSVLGPVYDVISALKLS